MAHDPGPAPDARPTLRSSRGWCDYFRHNAEHLLAIPWERGAELTEAERDAVAASLQAFQLGESSTGRHFLRCAAEYGQRTGDQEYLEAVQCFLAEEHRHARTLGQFLELAGIPLLPRTWPDTAFRRLRKLAGLDVCLCVLVTAEIIAKVYYAAVRAATRSVVLRRVCDQLLRDEVRHVRFQAERLAMLREARPRWRLWLTQAAFRCFYWGTCLIVWRQYRRTFRAGGYGMRRCFRDLARELQVALRQMDPRSYRTSRSFCSLRSRASCSAIIARRSS
jgi:hypothetical protein